MKVGRPNPADAPACYPYFLELAKGDDLIAAVSNQQQAIDVYSARSLGWFTVGHNIHHYNLIKEK